MLDGILSLIGEPVSDHDLQHWLFSQLFSTTAPFNGNRMVQIESSLSEIQQAKS